MAQQRVIGLDLIRIFAMVLITGIHFICYSSVRCYVDDIPICNRLFISFFDTFAQNWITLFLLISGYFMCQKNATIDKATRLWINVIFVSIIVAIPCIVMYWKNPIWEGGGNLIQTVFPVLTRNYWYIGGYLLLLLLTPLLNAYSSNASRKSMLNLLITITIIYTFLHINKYTTPEYFFGAGTSVFHFAFVYLLGSYLRLHSIGYSKLKLGTTLLITTIAMYTLKLSGAEIVAQWGLLSNTSIIPLVWSVSLFCIMLNVQIHSDAKWLTTISSASLTVYLVQENACFREFFWRWIDADNYAYSLLYIIRWIEAIIVLWTISIVVNKLYNMLKKPIFMPIEQAIVNIIGKIEI